MNRPAAMPLTHCVPELGDETDGTAHRRDTEEKKHSPRGRPNVAIVRDGIAHIQRIDFRIPRKPRRRFPQFGRCDLVRQPQGGISTTRPCEYRSQCRNGKSASCEAELELARLKGPPHITDPQKAFLARALAAFHGQPVTVSVIPERYESTIFKFQLAEVLRTAGLLVDEFSQPSGSHVLTLGVAAIAHEGNAKGKRFAEAFAKALNEIGVAASASTDLLATIGGDESGDNRVTIVVGDKP